MTKFCPHCRVYPSVSQARTECLCTAVPGISRTALSSAWVERGLELGRAGTTQAAPRKAKRCARCFARPILEGHGPFVLKCVCDNAEIHGHTKELAREYWNNRVEGIEDASPPMPSSSEIDEALDLEFDS